MVYISAILILSTSLLSQHVIAEDGFCYPTNETCFPSASEIQSFADSLSDGYVIYPSEKQSYDNVTIMRNVWRTGFPFAVVMAHSAADVKDTIDFAVKYNLHLTVKTTGHDYNGRSTGNNTLMINLIEMRNKSVNLNDWRNPAGVITVDPGNMWIDVYREVDRYNRVIVGGSAKTVGVSGYTLGGGHSPICRSFGMGIDNLLEVDMVMADGRIVTAAKDFVYTRYANGTTSNTSDSELFWAIAGGGGGTFGIATRFVFKLHMPPEKVVRLYAVWPILLPDKVTNIGKLVLTKLGEVISNKTFPKEWGGYILLSGAYDSTYGTTGSISLFFNHLGGRDTTTFKYMNSMMDYLSNYRLIDIKDYDTFLDYEETVNEQYPYYLVYVFNSLIGAEGLTEDFVDHLIETLLSNSDVGYTGTLIGGRMSEVGVIDTSVHPGFRTGLISLSGGVIIEKIDVTTILQKIYKAEQLGAALSRYGNGMYPNEAGQIVPQWQHNFWGYNYARLMLIKLREDPDVIFTCSECVGSEFRSVSGRLAVTIPLLMLVILSNLLYV